MNQLPRGKEREQSLPRDAYFSEGYFALTQLCSLSQQIHEIHQLKPKSILEVGIGNGFTSSFLKRSGYDVTTADINPALQPDICAPLDELASRVAGRRFDLVVCCEVLEHMPFDQFEDSLEHFSSLGQRLFMTLPNYRVSVGFGGFLRLPKISPKLLGFTVDVPRKKALDKEHFWEVGSSRETTRKKILSALATRYPAVGSKKLALNPYHIAFYGSGA
jgi:hypothetical protein